MCICGRGDVVVLLCVFEVTRKWSVEMEMRWALLAAIIAQKYVSTSGGDIDIE